MTISLDWETFSRADLRAVGAWSYAMHESTEGLCFAYAFDDDPAQWWAPGKPIPSAMVKRIKSGERIRAFNANFERAITLHVVSRQLPWFPPVAVEQWDCTQALAAMCSLPLSLAACGAALGSPQQKDPKGAALLRRFAMPRKPTKKDARTRILPSDDPEGFAELVRYCLQDVETERAIRKLLPIAELPPAERRVWELDSEINRRGVLVDVDMARGAQRIAARTAAEGITRLRELSGGTITKPGQVKVIRAFCAARKTVLPSLDKLTVATALRLADGEADKLHPQVREVLTIRQDITMSSLAKYARMLGAMGPDHRLRGMAQYHAASTGRWGGRIVQLQNLPRPTAKKGWDIYADLPLIRAGDPDELIPLLHRNPMEAMRDAIRPTLRAADGHTFIISDFSSIEARVLGWLANDAVYLDAFRKGLDLYKVAAAIVYHIDYDAVSEEQRQLGKVIILALGYSMGSDKFYDTCTIGYNLKVSRELTDRAHASWRKTHWAIVNYWRNVERAAIACVKLRVRTRVGVVCFEMMGEGRHAYLTAILPSGRRLFYPRPELREVKTKWGARVQLTYLAEITGVGWVRNLTYGGKLGENLDQAIARDLEADAIVRSEAASLPVVMHTHDELVDEVPIGEAQAAEKTLGGIMRTGPAWAPGLPMNASVFVSNFYRK